MIIFKNKGFQTNELFPNEDWTGNALFVVKDSSDLANKIIGLYPNYEFVLDSSGALIDIVETPAPAPTEEQLREKYEYLTKEYIHDNTYGYSFDDENKIIREYLSDMTNSSYKEAFMTYNSYVEQCKIRAHNEVYSS